MTPPTFDVRIDDQGSRLFPDAGSFASNDGAHPRRPRGERLAERAAGTPASEPNSAPELDQSRVTAVRFMVTRTPGFGSSRTPMTVRAGRWAPIFSTYAAFIASKSRISSRKTLSVDHLRQVRADRFEHEREAVEDPSRLSADVRAGEVARRRIEACRTADRDPAPDLRDMAVRTDRRRGVRWRARSTFGIRPLRISLPWRRPGSGQCRGSRRDELLDRARSSRRPPSAS